MNTETNPYTIYRENTEGGEATAEQQPTSIKAPPVGKCKLCQVDTLNRALEVALAAAKLSFEQEVIFKRALRAEYTKLVLGVES